MTKFEYKMLAYIQDDDANKFKEKLAELGNEGWELVSVTPIDPDFPLNGFDWFIYYEASSTRALLFSFKRIIV